MADDDRFSSWGLCLAMLAFVGDAKDGLCGRTWVVSWRIGIRLGVPGASTDTDVLGEVLRRFAGEDSIGRNAGRFYQPAIRRRWGIAESTQSFGKIPESDKAGNVCVAYLAARLEGSRGFATVCGSSTVFRLDPEASSRKHENIKT